MDFLVTMDDYVTHDKDTWRTIIKNHYGVKLSTLFDSMTDDECFRFRHELVEANCFYSDISVFPAGIKLKLPNLKEIKGSDKV